MGPERPAEALQPLALELRSGNWGLTELLTPPPTLKAAGAGVRGYDLCAAGGHASSPIRCPHR